MLYSEIRTFSFCKCNNRSPIKFNNLSRGTDPISETQICTILLCFLLYHITLYYKSLISNMGTKTRVYKYHSFFKKKNLQRHPISTIWTLISVFRQKNMGVFVCVCLSKVRWTFLGYRCCHISKLKSCFKFQLSALDRLERSKLLETDERIFVKHEGSERVG